MNAGPFPVFCRGHSGGRILSEAYARNGIQMGHVAPDRKDTLSFAVALNPSVHELVRQSYRYPSLPEHERSRLRSLLRETVACFRARETDGVGPFGWKMGTNIFTMPVFLEALPTGKCVHLIRDGRDVMLSRLDNRFDFSLPVNRLMVFGDERTDTFLDRPLTAALVTELRDALEMRHWVTAVEYGLRGRAFGDRYLEVRYEALCADPALEGQRIFDFLEVPLLSSTRAWLITTVSSARIGKWRTLPENRMALPMAIGHDLLGQLGYV